MCEERHWKYFAAVAASDFVTSPLPIDGYEFNLVADGQEINGYVFWTVSGAFFNTLSPTVSLHLEVALCYRCY